jgi:hypothetical protein
VTAAELELLTTQVANVIREALHSRDQQIAALTERLAAFESRVKRWAPPTTDGWQWQVGARYDVDDVTTFDNKTFRCRIAHVSQGPTTDQGR